MAKKTNKQPESTEKVVEKKVYKSKSVKTEFEKSLTKVTKELIRYKRINQMALEPLINTINSSIENYSEYKGEYTVNELIEINKLLVDNSMIIEKLYKEKSDMIKKLS